MAEYGRFLPIGAGADDDLDGVDAVVSKSSFLRDVFIGGMFPANGLTYATIGLFVLGIGLTIYGTVQLHETPNPSADFKLQHSTIALAGLAVVLFNPIMFRLMSKLLVESWRGRPASVFSNSIGMPGYLGALVHAGVFAGASYLILQNKF